MPHHGPTPGPFVACIVCGERGLADVLLNTIMFLPLGALLALRGVPLRGTAFAALVLSVLIEGVQIPLEGRDASLGDVVFNTVGGVAGFVLARVMVSLLVPGSRATWASVAAAMLVLGIIGGTGFLLQPAFPDSVYWGQWTANLGHLQWYRGRVRQASIGDLALPSRRLDDSRRVRHLLLAGERLDVRSVAGRSVSGLAPLFSIFDDRQREIVLLGPDHDDLVWRYRTRASAWTLDQPDLRLPGTFSRVAAGDTMRVAVWREARGYCLALNDARTCGLGFTAGRGWAILLYAERFPPWLKVALDVGWLAGLLALVGLAGGPRSALIAGGAAIGIGLGGIAPLTGLVASPPIEWVGAGLGLAAGMGLRTVLTGAFRETGNGKRET